MTDNLVLFNNHKMGSTVFYVVTIIYFLLTFWIVLKRWTRLKKAQFGIFYSIVYWLAYLAIIVVSYFVLLVIFFWLIFFASSDYRKNEFDARKWKNEPETRVIMVDDLIERRLLENKSRNEVIAILGKTSSIDPLFDSIINDFYRTDSLRHDTDLIYVLGARRGMLQKTRYLEIWFKNDTVCKYKY